VCAGDESSQRSSHCSHFLRTVVHFATLFALLDLLYTLMPQAVTLTHCITFCAGVCAHGHEGFQGRSTELLCAAGWSLCTPPPPPPPPHPPAPYPSPASPRFRHCSVPLAHNTRLTLQHTSVVHPTFFMYRDSCFCTCRICKRTLAPCSLTRVLVQTAPPCAAPSVAHLARTLRTCALQQTHWCAAAELVM